MIDEDAAHRPGRDREEVRPVLPADVPLVDEPHIGLVNERRRLQRVVRTFTAEVAARPSGAARCRQRPSTRRLPRFALAPGEQQTRDVETLGHVRPPGARYTRMSRRRPGLRVSLRRTFSWRRYADSTSHWHDDARASRDCGRNDAVAAGEPADGTGRHHLGNRTHDGRTKHRGRHRCRHRRFAGYRQRRQQPDRHHGTCRHQQGVFLRRGRRPGVGDSAVRSVRRAYSGRRQAASPDGEPERALRLRRSIRDEHGRGDRHSGRSKGRGRDGEPEVAGENPCGLDHHERKVPVCHQRGFAHDRARHVLEGRPAHRWHRLGVRRWGTGRAKCWSTTTRPTCRCATST